MSLTTVLEQGRRAMAMRGGRLPQVKNRAPAPIQITAEHILREARERQVAPVRPVQQRITDSAELAEYRLRKRKEFEDRLRLNRERLGTWLQYAKWEEGQKCFDRARSIYERALEIDYRSPDVWRRYAEMEMKNKYINHARNVWDRAVTVLPRVNQLWYRYTYMEEMVGNVPGARAVFERWMQWEPDEQAWMSYAKMEIRAGQLPAARDVYERFVACHPVQRSYIRYAKWEERQMQRALARQVFERALLELPDVEKDEALYIAFGSFEERCREYERARAIYKHGLEVLDKAAAQNLYKEYISFEKKHGAKDEIEDVILDKRRFQYEEQLKANPLNYDVWFDYARLEESNSDASQVREVYERAVACVPPKAEKRLWKRYIFLWIYYALYEELETEDAERARAVFRTCLDTIPHKKFTFSKLWIMYAHFEVRQLNLAAARKALGTAIGKCPTDKLFRAYIHLELQLGEIDRCRALYSKLIEFKPGDSTAWTRFAELEKSVGESDRARAVFELAITQPVLDAPESVWKAYIDFEVAEEEHERTRALYERLLERTQHVKVFISFAQFEASVGEPTNARTIFERADAVMKEEQLKEERKLVLEAWHAFETELGEGNEENTKSVTAKLPKAVTKKRMIQAEDGSSAGWEEYIDYIFPDDQQAKSSLRILEMAHAWARKRKKPDSELVDEENEDGAGAAAADDNELDLDEEAAPMPEAATAAAAAAATASAAVAGAADEAEIDLED